MRLRLLAHAGCAEPERGLSVARFVFDDAPRPFSCGAAAKPLLLAPLPEPPFSWPFNGAAAAPQLPIFATPAKPAPTLGLSYYE